MAERLSRILSKPLSKACTKLLREVAGFAMVHGMPAVSVPAIVMHLMDLPVPADMTEASGRDPNTIKRECGRALDTNRRPWEDPERVLFDDATLAHIDAAVQAALRDGREAATLCDLMIAFAHGHPAFGDEAAAAMTAWAETNVSAVRARRDTPTLDRFGKDLTAAADTLPEAIGRDNEIDLAFRALSRATKANPILVGEAGVGKTAVVEGLAKAIAAGRCPPRFVGCRIIALTAAEIVAGCSLRGEFEERMTALIDEASNNSAVILFFDEFHTLVGGGKASGTMDAAGMLMPALARGKIRVIGATTRDEYDRFVQANPALERRVMPIDVDEPSDALTLRIAHGAAVRLAAHHGATFAEGAVAAAVTLASRHIPHRRHPDKAIDLLDEAAAKVRMAGATEVSPEEIAQLVAKRAGLRADSVGAAEGERLSRLRPALAARVIGQEEAVDAAVDAVLLARAGLRRPDRPAASLLFAGPTGVGKTETAKALADALGIALVRLDMSEYAESHSISRLLGSPPGYVGHEDRGRLIAALAESPTCVLLLDEFEKAHPAIHSAFLQAMDAGRMTDARGRLIDLRGVVLVATTNAGAFEAKTRSIGFTRAEGETVERDRALAGLGASFAPELLNRFDATCVFRPLAKPVVLAIAAKQLGELAEELAQRGVALSYTDEATQVIADAGMDPAKGARPIARAVDRLIRIPLAPRLLFGDLAAGGHAVVSAVEGHIVFAGTIEPKPARELEGRAKPARRGRTPPRTDAEAVQEGEI